MKGQCSDIQELIQMKQKAYEDFLSMTEMLKGALEGHDMAQVLGSLRRRGDLRRFIDGLDRKLAKRQQGLTGDQKKELVQSMAKATADLEKTLKEIGEINQVCASLAKRVHEGLALQLSRYQREKEGLRGYVPRTGRSPRFLNLAT